MNEVGTSGVPLRVAIVGSGPSGFYAAEALLASGLQVEVDMLERLPVPYGLVRFGVAPDHARLKTVTQVFDAIAQDPRFRFFGNVEVGLHVSPQDLSHLYHAIIVATGANGSRRLGIAGEDLKGVHSARDFVGWYNGQPGCEALQFDLSQEVAVIVGQGNVAIDVCRILAKPVDELRTTDIAQHALDALSRSKVREIHILGRRGPVQAKFTTKELRELGMLAGWQPIVDAKALDVGAACRAELEDPRHSLAAKNMAVLAGFAQRTVKSDYKSIHLHFLSDPSALQGQDRLQSVQIRRQRLEGQPGTQVAVPEVGSFNLPAGLLFRSVGYFGTPLKGLPFDERKGVLPNLEGRLLDGASARLTGWYAAGWIKRGPSGIIGTNRACSTHTVAALLADRVDMKGTRPGRVALEHMLGRSSHQVVGFDSWHAIEAAERDRGRLAGKTAEKFVRVEDMLAVASSQRMAQGSRC